MTGMMLIAICFVIIFRILIEKFCSQGEYKKRLSYAAGMMFCYTIILVSIIYMTGEYRGSQIPIKDFCILLCTIVFAMNIVLIFVIALYCSTAKKRSLSNREKIKLKDL